jgi:hypothetical protein
MAFRRLEANSAGWPPERNAIPGTAAGTVRRRHFHEGNATLLPLTEPLVAEDQAADRVAEPRYGNEQLPVGSPGLFGLGDSHLGKSLVARGDAFIDRQQTLAIGDHRSCRFE